MLNVPSQFLLLKVCSFWRPQGPVPRLSLSVVQQIFNKVLPYLHFCGHRHQVTLAVPLCFHILFSVALCFGIQFAHPNLGPFPFLFTSAFLSPLHYLTWAVEAWTVHHVHWVYVLIMEINLIWSLLAHQSVFSAPSYSSMLLCCLLLSFSVIVLTLVHSIMIYFLLSIEPSQRLKIIFF